LLLLKLLRLLFYCGGGAFIRVEIDDTSESEQAKRVEEKTQTKKKQGERERAHYPADTHTTARHGQDHHITRVYTETF
jgi:hypothetical protein